MSALKAGLTPQQIAHMEKIERQIKEKGLGAITAKDGTAGVYIVQGKYVYKVLTESAMKLKEGAHAMESKRPTDPTRHVLDENDPDPIPVDMESDLRPWWEESMDPDMYDPQIGLPAGLMQARMWFYEGPLERDITGQTYSRFIEPEYRLTFEENHRFPRSEAIMRPICVKGTDCYAMSLWMSTTRNLSKVLPFDFHQDGYPHFERTCIGTAFRPRANMYDFPGPYGNCVADRRIAFGIFGGDQIYFGGDGFSPLTSITDEMFANHHHYFVDISSANWAALLSLADDPEEILRRTQGRIMNVLQPRGALSSMSTAIERLEPILGPLRNSPDMPTPQDFRTIMDNIPARGYDAEGGSWEIFPMAATSSALWAGVANCLQSNERARRPELIAVLDVLDRFLNHRKDTANPKTVAPVSLTDMVAARNTLARQISTDEVLALQTESIIEGVPTPHAALEALPVQVYDFKARTFVGELFDIVRSTDYNTANADPIKRFGARGNDDLTPSSWDHDAVVPRSSYSFPFGMQSESGKESLAPLLSRLTSLDMSAPDIPATPTTATPAKDTSDFKKRKLNPTEEASPSVRAAAKKDTAKGKGINKIPLGTNDNEPGLSTDDDNVPGLNLEIAVKHGVDPFTNVPCPKHPPGTHWVYTAEASKKVTQAAVKDFKVTRQDRIDDNISLLNAHVNRHQIGLGKLGLKWGTMVGEDGLMANIPPKKETPTAKPPAIAGRKGRSLHTKKSL